MTGSPVISNLRFEHHPTGLGVPASKPRLSWRYANGPDGVANNFVQTSYVVEIKRGAARQIKSFEVSSDNNHLNAWPDEPLLSRERAWVRISANGICGSKLGSEGDDTVKTPWSEWKSVEAALLQSGDWTAHFITSSKSTAVLGKSGRKEYFRPIRLRKTFTLDKQPGSARLYITALGVYVAYMNGKRIGDEQMAPGWTAYQHRLQYQVFDVTDMLRADGTNTLVIEVAEGWYAGRLTWKEGVTCFYGDEIGASAQLEMSPSDSASHEPSKRILSDETWEWHESAILKSGIYDGEEYDMREDEDGLTDVQDRSTLTPWQPVKTMASPKATLLASPSPPVRVTEVVKPVKIFRSPTGKTLVDFGQNLVGNILIHDLSRPAGHVLTIRYAEVLEHEELGTRPLRCAKATDRIIFSSKPLQNYSPHFTFHGFRYIELDGWSDSDASGPLTASSISALVMHTDMTRTGHFECSNSMLNQLHHNVVWSMKSNFFSIPTDCPQRDERLGWTGDIQVFTPTASFLFDCSGMLGNWMRDLILDQKDTDGIVPLVVPNALLNNQWPTITQAVWDDVVVLVPWTLYSWFGDTQVLRETYRGMMDYLTVIPRSNDGLWDPEVWQLGDWLDPAAPPDNPGDARTDGTMVADAYLVHILRTVTRIAGVLGEEKDEKKYGVEAEKLAQTFRRKYISAAGLVVSDSQTGVALTLAFDLHDALEVEARKTAAERLGRLVRKAKYKVATGFAGTPVVLPALSSAGDKTGLQLAYRMLLEEECPSWLYPVKMGATTIWERWDSMLPDGSINPGQMTSFNHYALGSVAAWMHAVIGGLTLLEPGWKKFRVQPKPGGDITCAKIEFLSPQGLIKCDWKIENKTFKMKVTVPPNATAVVVLPDTEKEGGDDEGQLLGSGVYQFECKYRDPGPWPPGAAKGKSAVVEEALERDHKQ